MGKHKFKKGDLVVAVADARRSWRTWWGRHQVPQGFGTVIEAERLHVSGQWRIHYTVLWALTGKIEDDFYCNEIAHVAD